MRVIVTKRFRDRQSGVDHQRGEILVLPPDRAQALVATGCGKVVGQTEEPPKRKPGRPPKDKAARPDEDKDLFA
jgi:hypothetical protein